MRCANKLYRPNATDPSDCAHCNRVAEDAAAEFRLKWPATLAEIKADYVRRIEDAVCDWQQSIGTAMENALGFDPFESNAFPDYPSGIAHMEHMIQVHGIKGLAEDSYVDRAVNDAHDQEES